MSTIHFPTRLCPSPFPVSSASFVKKHRTSTKRLRRNTEPERYCPSFPYFPDSDATHMFRVTAAGTVSPTGPPTTAPVATSEQLRFPFDHVSYLYVVIVFILVSAEVHARILPLLFTGSLLRREAYDLSSPPPTPLMVASRGNPCQVVLVVIRTPARPLLL